MNNRNCTSCEYGYKDELNDYVCVNDKSELCTEYVDKNNICEYWEVEE